MANEINTVTILYGGLPLSGSNKLPVEAALDTTGLATSAKQDTGNGYLQTLVGVDFATGGDITSQTSTLGTILDAIATELISGTLTVSGSVTVSGTVGISGSVAVTGTFWQATQPISAAALPLPSNAAQEAGGNLAAIAGKDFATQTTLAALLAKVIAAPSTEAKQDALNALITTIDAVLDSILAKIIAAPATEAKQDAEITHLAAIRTAVEALDNAVGGNELQVDIVGSLPAGNNNVGDVDVASIAAGDNNIGNVDIVTVPADPFGANADAASASGSISAKLRAAAVALELLDDILGTVAAGTAATKSALAGLVYRASPPAPTDGQQVAAAADNAGNLLVALPRVSYTNRSGTITAGGSSQQLAAVNTTRRGLFVRNNSTDSLWINFTSDAVAAQPSLELLPGAYWEMEPHMVTTEKVTIIGATTGQSFTAKEW